MISINKNTRYHIRIDNEYELELLCSYLNTRFPGKFHWNLDNHVNEVTKEYIKKICTYKMQTLCLDTNYRFTYSSSSHYKVGDIDHFGNKVISVYDLEGIYDLNNSAKETQNLLSWLY